jgi:hypothetical protein
VAPSTSPPPTPPGSSVRRMATAALENWRTRAADAGSATPTSKEELAVADQVGAPCRHRVPHVLSPAYTVRPALCNIHLMWQLSCPP